MAQFKPFNPNVEVTAETVLVMVEAFPKSMQQKFLQHLKEKNIVSLEKGTWYSQSDWLASMELIYTEYGPNTMFNIGKTIPENVEFPPGIDSIEKALSAIDTGYQMNHRNGDVGFYRVEEHDIDERHFVIRCKNPYPCDFDRGIITSMARKFKRGVKVELDTSKASRNQGADDSWYILTHM